MAARHEWPFQGMKDAPLFLMITMTWPAFNSSLLQLITWRTLPISFASSTYPAMICSMLVYPTIPSHAFLSMRAHVEIPAATGKKREVQQITYKSVIQRLKEYANERLDREKELIAALKKLAPQAVLHDPAAVDSFVSMLKSRCPQAVLPRFPI